MLNLRKSSNAFLILAVIFLLVTGNHLPAQQFLRVEGKKIMKGNQEILLRGMGPGGWMLQEPYMLKASGFATTQHEIRAKIEALVGPVNTQAFYDAWLANHMRKSDVDSLAAWGFNSIRLPMHYNLFTLPIEAEPVPGEHTWLETGFTLTDSLLSWCAANEMFLILDLHAAPGGQGHELSICDGDDTKPSLWESDLNKGKTIALWAKLAAHYADSEWIGGYDLINEPNWELPGGTALRQLYVQITDNIRTVDTNHIIFIEGNWFANDFTGLTPPWDDNMVYSFHKYWNYNTVQSIQWALDLRNNYNIPLWLGESGENSNAWFTDCIRLVEGNNIGWAWWPLKKIDALTNPLNVQMTSGYQALLDYWSGQGPQPSIEFAVNALMEIAENLKTENCEFQRGLIDAMFRQVNTDLTMPYVPLAVPDTVFCADYDLGMPLKAYDDKIVADYHSNTNTYTSWNSGNQYRNDGVDLEICQDASNNCGFNVGWIEDGEWLQYTAGIPDTAVYDIRMRVASPYSGFGFHFQLDDVDISPAATFPSTGGWQNWQTVTIQDVIMEGGLHRLRFVADIGGFNAGYFSFLQKGAPGSIPAKFISAATDTEGYLVDILVNKPLLIGQPIDIDNFNLTLDGDDILIDSIRLSSVNPKLLSVYVGEQIQYGDNIMVSYNGNSVMAADGTLLLAFSQKTVKNNRPVRYMIPGRIQAEDYSDSNGISTETTTDAGGGLNVGWTDMGDWMNYFVEVSEPGIYTVLYRVASYSQSGKIELQNLGGNPAVLHEVVFPVTGGWQTWTTVQKNVELTKGFYTFRILVKTAGFNLNWFEFVQSSGIHENDPHTGPSYKIFPNPSSGLLTIEDNPGNDSAVSVEIFDSMGRSVYKNQEGGNISFPYRIDLSTLPKGIYLVLVKGINSRAAGKILLQE